MRFSINFQSATTFGTKQLSIKFETHNIWKPLSLLFRHWNKIKSNTLINTGIDTPLAKAQNLYYYYFYFYSYYHTTTNYESRIDLHRPPPPSTSTNLQTLLPSPTSADLHRPPPTSATDLHHRPPPNSIDIRRLPPLPPKDVKAPIYGIVGNRIAFEGIASLNTHPCDRVIQNLLCSLYVQSDDEIMWKLCAVLAKNVNEAVKKRERLGCFLMESGQTHKIIYTAVCLVQ